ncbi:MAG TPA: hypothetical protein VEL76_31505 [Gemmataceae bacterium]|nr:hypothetical protein [Gemmataceae bacterium]
MSRSRTRARKRRALREEILAEFARTRENPEALEAMLRRLADSDIHIWAIVRPNKAEVRRGFKPLDEAENAMIAQVVAPHLAGMTPGSVHRRHKLAQ